MKTSYNLRKKSSIIYKNLIWNAHTNSIVILIINANDLKKEIKKISETYNDLQK